MSLPAGVVKYPDHGRRVPVTQRGWWTLMSMPDGSVQQHFTSCMFACGDMILERIGYMTPLLRGEHDYDGTDPHVTNMVLALHKASGRPLYQGSVVQDTLNAIAKLFPGEDVPLFAGTMNYTEITTTLANLGIIRFSVRPLTDMPRAWNLPAGYGGSGHAIVANKRERICYGAKDAARYNDGWADDGYHEGHLGVRELHIVDPMFRPASGYDGQWVAKDKFLSYADKDPNDGEYIVTWGIKSAAL